MSIEILAAEVFDPALSGDYDTAPRLEIMLYELPEEPSHVELNIGQYSIIHRNWLQSIFSDDPDWDDEDTELCAAQFNSSLAAESREPVMPVTIASQSKQGDVWQDYYVKVSRIQRILNRLERMREDDKPYYEVVPNALMAEQKMFGWTLAHPERKCVACVHDLIEDTSDVENFHFSSHALDISAVQSGCKMSQVGEFRQVPLCSFHTRKRNYEWMGRREKETG